MIKLRYFALLLLIYSCSDSDPGPSTPNCDNGPVITGVNTQDVSDCTTSDGQITIAATGSSALEYSIDGTNFQDSDTFTGLASGEYEITVRDNLGCTATSTGTISAPASTVAINDISASTSGCEQSSGSITVSATGQGDLTFSINGGSDQASNTFSGLTSGTYQVSVADGNGCSTIQSAKVLTGVSFEGQVKSIFVANCNISNCHDGSNSGLPDFNNFEEIKSRAADIKARTQSGNMPRNGSLTQEEKDLIACWVDDGALDN
ncbi:hypothetical protein [Fulvivirga lutimaris]|uniref:hypothetical protein n=1 Tax=Fulvivirga lutimaris TaxID=1819566 RepID=UPI0012BC9544|nr:hypothetical protein [Fulvivirga lutimaris]MTI39461.1 hypothetical protein [Fulvivirga lutimaris]